MNRNIHILNLIQWNSLFTKKKLINQTQAGKRKHKIYKYIGFVIYVEVLIIWIYRKSSPKELKQI